MNNRKTMIIFLIRFTDTIEIQIIKENKFMHLFEAIEKQHIYIASSKIIKIFLSNRSMLPTLFSKHSTQ